MDHKYVVPLMIVGYAGMLYMRYKQMKGKYKADGSYPRSTSVPEWITMPSNIL